MADKDYHMWLLIGIGKYITCYLHRLLFQLGCNDLVTTEFTVYYHATRMHSADCAVARCLSVRLSHAGIEFGAHEDK